MLMEYLSIRDNSTLLVSEPTNNNYVKRMKPLSIIFYLLNQGFIFNFINRKHIGIHNIFWSNYIFW